MSADVQYSFFVRILTFDRTLQDGDARKIVIGVLYQEGVRSSVQAKDEFLSAAAESNIKQIFGKPVECVPILADDTALVSTLEKGGIVILYLTPLRAYDIGSLAEMMAEKKIVTITGVPEYVREGIAIGVGARADKPIILVNLQEAKRQGADLSAQLLKLAIIIK
jgi:hypothetical protein